MFRTPTSMTRKSTAGKECNMDCFMDKINSFHCYLSLSLPLVDGAKEVWAFINVLVEIVGVMMDTLPYTVKRVKLLKLKVKLGDIYFTRQKA
ncbi:hypothetical protein MQW34_28020 (plasmid) [Bacillus sp. ZJS3]|uniref:hypothetical protein n=1 Tax=Bacillus sp. ZJS3 TaxID=2928154 RepID=UPI001FB53EDA|nr:hypothetical protein [Bacillus sp. ZJS3]UOB81998.1 hypothetical protein MQW34_28020 [Bacillus sp. ZJS3]